MCKVSTVHSTPEDQPSAFPAMLSPRRTMATPAEMMLRDKKRSVDIENMEEQEAKQFTEAMTQQPRARQDSIKTSKKYTLNIPTLDLIKEMDNKLEELEHKHNDSVAVSEVIDNWARDHQMSIEKESYLKLYWDMSDEPSRAIKAILMSSGIRHEGWAIDRLQHKEKVSGPEKCIPYLMVKEREVLHYMTEEDKDVVQLHIMLDYLRNLFPSLVTLYPYEPEEQQKINDALDFNHNVLRPAFMKNIDSYYRKNIVDKAEKFSP